MTSQHTHAVLPPPTNVLCAAALGDAHGLSVEGMAPERIVHLYPHGLPVFSLTSTGGVVSDDTEHAAFTCHAWACAQGDVAHFRQVLAQHLRHWFWCVPPAIGWATLRAMGKLSLGWPPHRSGVSSAGNGPCIRAVVLGSLIENPHTLHQAVYASTQITHTHPLAHEGAQILAFVAHCLVQHHRWPQWNEWYQPNSVLPDTTQPDGRLRAVLHDAGINMEQQKSTQEFARQQQWKNGPQGFVVPTVAAVLHALWSKWDTWEDVVRAAVLLGGDTDSIAALVGALAHLDPHRGVLPSTWLDNMRDPVWSVSFLSDMEEATRRHAHLPLPAAFWPKIFARNMWLTGVLVGSGVKQWMR